MVQAGSSQKGPNPALAPVNSLCPMNAVYKSLPANSRFSAPSRPDDRLTRSDLAKKIANPDEGVRSRESTSAGPGRCPRSANAD